MEVGGLTITFTVLLFFCVVNPTVASHKDNHLREAFYKKTCPRAEEIVNEVVNKAIRNDVSVAAGLLRLHFHDCFVSGCDASVLLQGDDVEMDSPANHKSLQGMKVIDNAKTKVEKECPGIVSCADILAYAARDAAVSAGLTSYDVPGGRRDGLTSLAENTRSLPAPSYSVEMLVDTFADKGLDVEDVVVLSGAHSIGNAHCALLGDRLYRDNPLQPIDPSLNLLYALQLIQMCPLSEMPKTGLGKNVVPLDSMTPLQLDNAYYVGLLQGKGLLPSDQALMYRPKTARMVQKLAANPRLFDSEFRKSMVKLGKIDVLTGDKGEIRHSCRHVN